MDLTVEDYLNGVKRLEKSSAWKGRTQQYLLNRLSNINKLKKEVETGIYVPGKTLDFTINENGHIRQVKALSPNDSVLQHTITDSILTPTVTNYVIYDTGSGLKHRGLSFTRKRFEIHLKDFFKKYKIGYALIIDFSKYFDNIDHRKFVNQIHIMFNDEQLTRLIENICKQYEIDVSYSDDENIKDKLFNSLEYLKVDKSKLDGSRMMDKSLGIGAPVAQMAGLIYPHIIDNYIKTVLGMPYYDVYMDDRILLHESKDALKKILYTITSMANDLGISINPRKTKIVSINKEFSWLKTKYTISDTGKIIKSFSKDIVMREKRKLRKFNKMIQEGTMLSNDAISQYKAWRNSLNGYNCYYRLKLMDEYAERMINYGRTDDTRTNSNDDNSATNNKFGSRTIVEHFRNW